MPQAQFFLPDGSPIAEEELPAAFATGQARVQEGDKVTMRSSTGDVREFDATEFAQARELGYAPLSSTEVAQREREAEFGGLGQQVLTGAEALGRGATLGLSDAALGGVLGDDYSESAAARREVNPHTALAGEITGALAPVLLSGGAGAVGAASRLTPAALAARGGLAAERAVAGGLRALGADGATALGRATARALEMGAAGAVEGTAFGVGQVFSEASLANTDLTAEKLLAGGLDGLQLGGLGGAALGAGGSLAASAGRKLGDVAGALPGTRNAAEYIATRQTLKSYGLQGSDVSKLYKTYGEERVAQLARRIHEEKLLDAKDGYLKRAEKITAAADDAGEKLGELRQRLDATEVAAPKAADVMRRVREEVLGDTPASQWDAVLGEAKTGGTRAEQLLDAPATKALEDAVLEPLRESILAGDKLDFQSWARIRKKIDDRAWNENELKNRAGSEFLNKAARVIEEEVTGTIARNASPDLAQQYTAAKQRYSDLISIAGVATKRAGMEEGKRFFSLTDNMFASGGIGAALIGGSIEHAAIGLGIGLVNKAAREHGTAVVAKVARKIADMNERRAKAVAAILTEPKPIKRPAVQAPKKLAQASRVATLAGIDAPATQTVAGAAGTPEHELVISRALEYQQDPHGFTERLSEQLGPMVQTEPQLAQSVLLKAIADAQYLAANLPKGYTRANHSLTPLAEAAQYSRVELNRFLRKARAIEDPLSVIEDIAAGDLSLEGVRALRERRPLIYQELRRDIIKSTVYRREELPFSRRQLLGIAFEFPADRSLDPSYAQGLQQVYAEQAQAMEETKPPPQPTSAGMDDLAQTSMTPAQRLAMGV